MKFSFTKLCDVCESFTITTFVVYVGYCVLLCIVIIHLLCTSVTI